MEKECFWLIGPLFVNLSEKRTLGVCVRVALASISNSTYSTSNSSTGIILNSCRGDLLYFEKDIFDPFTVITL